MKRSLLPVTLVALVVVAQNAGSIWSVAAEVPPAELLTVKGRPSAAGGSDRNPHGNANVAGNAAAPAFARGASNLPVAGAVPDAATLALLLAALSLPSVLRPRRRSPWL